MLTGSLMVSLLVKNLGQYLCSHVTERSDISMTTLLIRTGAVFDNISAFQFKGTLLSLVKEGEKYQFTTSSST
jgi:hypothetical protein